MTLFLCRHWTRYIFQLTSSQGGWLLILIVVLIARYFNSHPHKEDDFDFCRSIWPIYISTHILTRRMTIVYHNRTCSFDISTHILTRRMTNQRNDCNAERCISTHILTRRMTVSAAIVASVSCPYFNSHPHKEDDWLTRTKRWERRYFNSHPHKEDDLLYMGVDEEWLYFNSHPHKEDDSI